MKFTVPGVPVAQPRQRHTRSGINYLPAKHPVNAYKATCRLAAMQAGVVPESGPVRLSATFVLPKPTTTVRKRDAGRLIWVAKKPDVDNLAKALLDSLSGVAWSDDSQVASLHISKRYAVSDGDGQPIEHAATEVEISQLE